MSIIDYSWDFTKEEFSLDLDFFNEKEQEDKLWQARTGLDVDSLCGAIETIIFMSDRPVNLLKIKNQIDNDLPLRVVHESIARLQAEYEEKHHGIRLMEVAQGYQFRTKATYSNLIQKMFKVESLQLSPTAVEVLSIIAYKQPISKTDVESIRGVDSSHIIRALMDRRLVKICGRSEEMGRPSLYGTTPEFLEVFNLNEITDLPSEIELDEIANANEIGEIADIKKIVADTDKNKFVFDEIEELDELSSTIREIAAETFFTKSLHDMDKKRTTEDGVEKKSAFDLLEEHVNQAQIVNANKSSVESETLTSVMEPRSVAAQMLNELLNHPNLTDEEFDIEIDMSEDIDEKLEDVLAKSEEIINDITENPEALVAAQTQDLDSPPEFDESILEAAEKALEEVEEMATEEESLEAALDAAFDDLMDLSAEDSITNVKEESSEQAEDSNENPNEFDDLDINPAKLMDMGDSEDSEKDL